MEIENNKKNLLVVGGTGFIGEHIVKESLKKGYKTTVISKNFFTPSEKFKDVSYLTIDILNKSNLIEKLQKKDFEYVINLSGYVDHRSFSNGGKTTFEVHFMGVKNLIDSLNIEKIKCFVQIGSSDEYGNNPAPQFEYQKEQPLTPYSCAKVLSTYFLKSLFQSENFPAIILRPFLVYGPGQKNQRFIPQVIDGCKSNLDFSVSSGNQVRDFCYVDDFVNAVFLSLDNTKAYGEIINIASGIPVKIRDVVNKIVMICGSGKPKFGDIPLRKSENMNLYADISKANDILKWKPKVHLNDGLSETISMFNKTS